MIKKTLKINGVERILILDKDETLAQVLRNHLLLTGCKIGCGEGHCGACNVIMNGKVTRSCIYKISRVPDHAEITTIEGVGTLSDMHPIQVAWMAYGCAQCGFCSPGFIISAKVLLDNNPSPTREEVREGLEKVLKERHDNNQPLDDITFAGNGEPTGHPDFKGIVEDTMELCKKYFPEAQVSVLSNATYIYKEEVREALMLVDNNILKLDTVDMDYIKKLDRPQQPNYDVKDVIKYLKMFKGHVIIQTMFLRGDGLDNTSEHFVAPWLEAVKDIQPQQVMVYTIARETPDKLLEKAPKEVLDAIKDRVEALGIKCTASY